MPRIPPEDCGCYFHACEVGKYAELAEKRDYMERTIDLIEQQVQNLFYFIFSIQNLLPNTEFYSTIKHANIFFFFKFLTFAQKINMANG